MEKIREYTPVPQSFMSSIDMSSRNENDFGINATYKDIEYTVNQLATEENDPDVPRTHFILCGDPGIGKTTIVEKALHEAIPDPAEYEERVKKFSGKASRAGAEVIDILRSNADDKILLFDDCDDWLKSVSVANILKVAMLDSKITVAGQGYNHKISEATDFNLFDSLFSNDEDKPIENHQVDDEPEQKAPTHSDEANGTSKTTSTFNFTSRFIFISNMDKNAIDSAILSRSTVIELKLNTAQVIDLLEEKVAATIPAKWPNGFNNDYKIKVRKRVLELLKVFAEYTNPEGNIATSVLLGPLKEPEFKNKVNFRTYRAAVELYANKLNQLQIEAKKLGITPNFKEIQSRCDAIVLDFFAKSVR